MSSNTNREGEREALDVSKLLLKRYRQRRFQSLATVSANTYECLNQAGEVLVERLRTYLADRPDAALTLPASAFAWLSQSLAEANENTSTSQRELLFLLPKVKQLRLTTHFWPKPSRRFTRAASIEDPLEFLEYFDQLQQHPNVDFTGFSQCQALKLERVPADWLHNIHSLPLRYLQIEHSFVKSLVDLLTTDGRSNFPELTNLTLNHCSLVEAAGLNRKVLLGLEKLKCLSLSHNELSREQIVFQNLRLSNLVKLDLSYNYFTTTKRIHRFVGNLQYLDLSHNRLSHITNLEKLKSLRVLRLDHNNLSTIASISGLARLPELSILTLSSNKLPKTYKVELWALFCEQRMDTWEPNVTLGQLRDLLPELDGTRPTVVELHALRNRMFRTFPIGPIDIVQRRCERRNADAREEAERPLNFRDTREPIVDFDEIDVIQALAHENDLLSSIHDVQEEAYKQDEGDLSVQHKVGRIQLNMAPAPPISLIMAFPEEESLLQNYVEKVKALPKEVEIRRSNEDHEEPENDNFHKEDGIEIDHTKSRLDASNTTPFDHNIVMEGSEESGATTAAASMPASVVEPLPSDKTEDGRSIPDVPISTPKADRNVSIQASDQSSDTPTSPSMTSPSPFGLRVVSFPNNAWNDDSISVPYSTASSHLEESSVISKFQSAESRSRFVGPETLKQLYVHENLELYFRLFVFASDSEQHPNLLSPSFDDDEINYILQNYPKIQLWPVDRRLRESALFEHDIFALKGHSREEFRRVWKENVVGCGKAALKRLTPSRKARFGFHGELLWSAAETSHLKPETIIESRDVILCLSDVAFYIILDHDAVTTKARDQKRKFPNEIPRDACFVEARWPHALARHSLENLKSITIGFSFQRLSLRFRNTLNPESGDFCYILLTSSKTQTITLLKEIQDLVNQMHGGTLDGGTLDGGSDILQIENDDREVLDAMAAAIAPDVLGTVIHYQILIQYWRSGDRGFVRRVCVVSDSKIFLLDEDYEGDGSDGTMKATLEGMGKCSYRLVDSAPLSQISAIQIPNEDPKSITITVKPLSAFQRSHNWRLICRDRHGAERLAEDIKKAFSMA